MRNNDGFTLVEVIVAVLCSSLVIASVVLIMDLAFKNYKTIRLEAELQIEAQVLESKLSSILRGAKSYNYEGNILEVKGNRIDSDVIEQRYYYFIFDNGKSYLVTSSDKLDSPSYSDSNYLSNFIENVDIVPQSIDTNSEVFNHEVEITINEEESGVHYSKCSDIRLRQGE